MSQIGDESSIKEGTDDILSDPNNLFISEEEPPKIAIIAQEEPKKGGAKVIFESNKQLTNTKQSEPAQQTESDKIKPQIPTTKLANQFACKSNSDCDNKSYCSIATNQCTSKIQLGQIGCESTDQCLNSICLGKKCTKGCRLDSDCSKEESCSILKKSALNGVDWKGFCKSNSQSSSVAAKDSKEVKQSSPSAAVISGIIVASIIGVILGVLYFRGLVRRRMRNKNPDSFLFNKLHQSAGNSGLGRSDSFANSKQLNEKLIHISGARFAKWSPQTNTEG